MAGIRISQLGFTPQQQRSVSIGRANPRQDMIRLRRLRDEGRINTSQLNAATRAYGAGLSVPQAQAKVALAPVNRVDTAFRTALNIGEYNPVRALGAAAQTINTNVQGSRFAPVGRVLTDATKGFSNFGKTRGTVADPTYLNNRVASNVAPFLQQAGLMANFSNPVTGAIATAGIGAEAQQDIYNHLMNQGKSRNESLIRSNLGGAGSAAVARISNKAQLKMGMTGAGGFGRRMLTGAATEGAEEAVEAFIQNAAAGKPLGENVVEGAKQGAIYGGIFQGLFEGANRAGVKMQEVEVRKELENRGVPKPQAKKMSKSFIKAQSINQEIANQENVIRNSPNQTVANRARKTIGSLIKERAKLFQLDQRGSVPASLLNPLRLGENQATDRQGQLQATQQPALVSDTQLQGDTSPVTALTSPQQTQTVRLAPTRVSSPSNLSSTLDIQKYNTFDKFYQDYKTFFDEQGYTVDQAARLYAVAQSQPATVAANTNRELKLDQARIEDGNLTDTQRLQAAQGDTGIAGLMSAQPGTRRYNPVTRQIETIPAANNNIRLRDRLTGAFRDQGGFVRLPGGNNDITAGLSQEQTGFINDYAEMLEGMSSEGGVTINQDGTRSSSNSPFYREVYAEKGRPPTKAEWFAEGRRQIESGQAAFGASADYKHLATDTAQPTTETGQQRQQTAQSPQTQRIQSTPQAAQPSMEQRLLAQNQTSVQPTDTTDRGVRTSSSVNPLTGDSITETTSRNAAARNPLLGRLDEIASLEAEFNAYAAKKGSKRSNTLAEAIKADDMLTQKARQAQMDGTELNFYAEKDRGGRTVGIKEFAPKNYRIEAGFVVDRNGTVLGNHIKVDSTGIQVNVGGDIVNMESIIGNPADWEGTYRAMETVDRNMQRLAPDEATYRKSRSFVIDNKLQHEAEFRTELSSARKTLQSQAKSIMRLRPGGTSKTEFKSDIFDYIEGKLTDSDLQGRYSPETFAAINNYKTETRQLYDSLLDRVNAEFGKFGEAQVPRRQDYLTHINELSNTQTYAGELFGRLQNSMIGEGNARTRGSVPANIAGRTDTFQPRKKWNRFFQPRKNGEFTKDPFLAVDAYLEPTLYNIHMTEPAVRARAIEAAFRTAAEIQQRDLQGVNDEFQAELKKNTAKPVDDKITNAFAEFANALAGKTQRADRIAIDTSATSAFALRSWQQLQRIGGRSTILGNAQSVLSQTLNQNVVFPDVGVKAYLKGISSSLTKSTPIDKSPFITARKTNVDSPFASGFDKTMNAGGVPLQQVELAMVKLSWNAEYHKAVADGYKGQAAIAEADRRTERVVAGRGIADKPEAYRSTIGNGFLQYTLEVSASNKKVWNDFNTVQKAEFMAASLAMNTVIGAITGFEPLPDFLGAAIDGFKDMFDDDDERSAAEKALNTGQRLVGEGASMNPLASAAFNLLPQDVRRTLFTEESDLARFEGTAAPLQVAKNAINAGTAAASGDFLDARNNALRTIPFGNQIRKTLTGAETLNRGYGVDRSGNPTFAAPESLAGKAQTLLFGPSATAEAGQYYDNKQTGITGKSDMAAIRTSSNPRQTVADLRSVKIAEKQIKDSTGVAPTVKIGASSTKGSDGTYTSRTNYDAVIDAFKESDGSNIAKYDENELRTAIRSVANEGQKLFTTKGIPTDGIKFDSRFAQEYAKYAKKQEGANAIEKKDNETAFLRNTIRSTVSELERDLYKQSQDEIIALADQGLITGENIQNALALEKRLYDAGLITKETFARKLELEARGYKTSGRGGRGGSRKSGGIKLSDVASAQGQLADIMQQVFKVAPPKTSNKVKLADVGKVTIGRQAPRRIATTFKIS